MRKFMILAAIVAASWSSEATAQSRRIYGVDQETFQGIADSAPKSVRRQSSGSWDYNCLFLSDGQPQIIARSGGSFPVGEIVVMTRYEFTFLYWDSGIDGFGNPYFNPVFLVFQERVPGRIGTGFDHATMQMYLQWTPEGAATTSTFTISFLPEWANDWPVDMMGGL